MTRYHRIKRNLTALTLISAMVIAPCYAAGEKRSLVIPLGTADNLDTMMKIGKHFVEILNENSRNDAELYLPLAIPEEEDDSTEVKKALKHLIRSLKSARKKRWSRAVKAGKTALKAYKQILKRSGIQSSAQEGYLQTLHTLAAIAFARGQMDEAKKRLNDAFLLNTEETSLKGPIFSERFLAYYKSISEAANPLGKGTLVLESDIPAVLLVNGELHGIHEGQLTLRAGLYLFTLYNPAKQLRRRWFRVKTDQERVLRMSFQEDGNAGQRIAALKDELYLTKPGLAVEEIRALEEVDQLFLISAADNCSPQSCKITMRKSDKGEWRDFKKAIHRGNVKDTALALARTQMLRSNIEDHEVTDPDKNKNVTKTGFANVKICKTDADCGPGDYSCNNFRCEKNSIFSKWWFWTAVGAVITAGAAVGLTFALTSDSGSVIEVK